MKLTTFLSAAFFAAGIFAAPHPKHEVERLVRRGPFSGRLQLSGNTTRTIEAEAATPTIISINWAGALLPSPPAGETFTDVVGQITVPAAPAAGTSVTIWVGIDGTTANSPCIQGGIHISAADDGTVTYESWTEWVPDPPVFYDQATFPFTTGDVLLMGIAAQAGEAQATLLIENDTNGKALGETFSPSDASNVALGQTAEWVVERPAGTTLSNFGTITFSDAGASASSTTVDLSGASALSIENSATDPTIIATGSIPDVNDITVTYTGP